LEENAKIIKEPLKREVLLQFLKKNQRAKKQFNNNNCP